MQNRAILTTILKLHLVLLIGVFVFLPSHSIGRINPGHTEFPPYLGGSITNSPLIQNIAYGATPAQLTASVATGGTCGGAYSYQWEVSTDSSTFTNISGATSQNYQPGALYTKT